jgi:hypothetical protein
MRTGMKVSLAGLGAGMALAACGGGDDGLPQLQAARAGTLTACSSLSSSLALPHTTLAAASDVAAGTLMVAGKPVGAHCLVTGSMYPRTSAVDGQNYAIGFEMRLPQAWNGRFFYQANGGIDGAVTTATGGVNGGSGLDNALNQGFAVISSDAGHTGSRGPFFGLDPQARLDYGYQAAAKLTPMAKAVIQAAYGRAPDRSYFGGCSNGGRHTLVAASRLADQYDGFLAGAPGYRLPKAAIANIAGAQTYATLATSSDLSTAFTATERNLVSQAVLAKCDALDGATDGIVQDGAACRSAFSLDRDVPTCSGARDGSCLSSAQKAGIGRLFAGAITSAGSTIYNSFPFDTGIRTAGWASWKFTAPIQRDSGAVALIWQAPPADPATFDGTSFALSGNIDAMLDKVSATSGVYTESAMSFMTPPHPSDLGAVKSRGAKLMIYHGSADPIFSSDDTAAYYDALRQANGGDASNFARYFPVPGMNHCSGGPATDQFDMLTPLVAWVEQGQAPDSVRAQARGAGNAAAVNTDLPTDWSATRSRPLCPYPQVARYTGSGSVEDAANFSCR